MTGIDQVEKYLMSRAKGSIDEGDSCMAKSWLLTCSILFPRSFALQYDRYQIAKKEGNVGEASACLCEMLQNPEGSDYPELKQEKRAIVEVIRFDGERAGTSAIRRAKVHTSGTSTPVSRMDEESRRFLRAVFNSLSPGNKHKILMSVAKESDACWYDSCQLMILTLTMFPAEIGREGWRLVQQVDRAREVDTPNKDVYMEMLIFDALPLILHPDSGIQFTGNFDDLRVRLLSVLHYFTLNSAISDPGADACGDQELEQKVTEILLLAFRKMGWRSDLIDAGNESMDVTLIRLSNAFADLTAATMPVTVKTERHSQPNDGPMDLSVPTKKQKTSHRTESSGVHPVVQEVPLLFSSVLIFLKCLLRYARESRSSDSVLVELVHQVASGSSTTVKTKMIPHFAASSSGILLPEIISRSPDDQRLRSAFLTCVKCIDMVISGSNGMVHDFFSLLKKIGAEDSPSYQDLRRDACFFKGQHEDFIRQTMQLITSPPDHSIHLMIQIMSASLVIHDYQAAIRHAVTALQSPSSLPSSKKTDQEAEGSGKQANDLPHGYRMFQFMPLTADCVFDFCIECIITSLRFTTLLSLKPSDAGIGHLIVLSQYKWPRHVDVFKACVSLIRKPLDAMPTGRSAQPQIHRFTYFPFLDYVRHPDMLEEFMSLCLDERLQLELSSGASTIKSLSAGQRQMTTRGVNKGAKEEVRISLVKQMMDSKDVLDRETFIEFIVNVLRLMT